MQPTDLPQALGHACVASRRAEQHSGVTMIAKCKTMRCHVVPVVRPSWSSTNLLLVAMLFLHLRRLWHPPGEATAEDKIPL